MLAPGAATTSTSSASASKSARKCTELFSARMRLRRRIDAQMAQDGAVRRLQAARRHRDLDARRRAGAQQRHRPEIHPVAAIHRPGRGEPAVAEAQHLEVADQRPHAAGPVAAAERQPVQDRPLARARVRRRRPRVAQQRQQRALGPRPRSAPRAGRSYRALPPPPGLSCVSARMTGRPPSRRIAWATASAGVPQPAGEARLGRGEGGGQPLGRGVGGRRLGRVGQHGRAADRRVGGREAHADRGRRARRPPRVRRACGVERAAGLDRGALPGQRHQEVDAPPRLGQRLAGHQRARAAAGSARRSTARSMCG